VEQRAAQGQILLEIGLPGIVRDGGGALEDAADVQTDERGGKHAHRAQHAEAAADVLGDRKLGITLGLGERVEVALVGGGHGGDAGRALRPSFAVIQSRTIRKEATVSAVEPDLAITTVKVFLGFIESRAAAVKAGVDVVQDDQPGIAGREGRLDRVRAPQAAIERPGAQGAAADTHQAKRVEGTADLLGETEDIPGGLGLKRKMREALVASLTDFLKAAEGLQSARGMLPDLGRGKAMGFPTIPARRFRSSNWMFIGQTDSIEHIGGALGGDRLFSTEGAGVGILNGGESLGHVVVPGQSLLVHQRPEQAETDGAETEAGRRRTGTGERANRAGNRRR